MRTKREKETGHCRICCGNRRSDVPSKTLTLDFIRIRCVGTNTIDMILHQISPIYWAGLQWERSTEEVLISVLGCFVSIISI